MSLLTDAEYLELGHQILPLLGSALAGSSAESLRDLALVYDPTADKTHISAEVFLFHKFLLMQACVGVFPERHVDHVVGGLFAALNERASGMDIAPERQQAMEAMWQQRAEQLDGPFSQDRRRLLAEVNGPVHWKQTIGQFCRNVREMESPPDLWAGSDGPSHLASQSVTAALDQMVAALREINRLHFGGAV